MTTFLQVVPGINLSRLFGTEPLTKEAVREAMRSHPEWDWRIITPNNPTYVNGRDCVRYDVQLEVRDPKEPYATVARLVFQKDSESRLQAVVH